jgi:hypothetical protein
LVEAFFSQYHEPTIPYEVKIALGLLELALLSLFLARAGANRPESRVLSSEFTGWAPNSGLKTRDSELSSHP